MSLILDTILRLTLYQPGPVSDNLSIFAPGSLIVVLSIELDFELRAALDEGCNPVLADWVSMAFGQQRISHIFHSSKPGRKPSRVKVE
jgi:hypothetical protein